MKEQGGDAQSKSSAEEHLSPALTAIARLSTTFPTKHVLTQFAYDTGNYRNGPKVEINWG